MKSLHAFWKRTVRYGEALNPGPHGSRLIRIAVCSPTAVNRKEADLLGLRAELICLAATSAVAQVKRSVARNMSRHKYRSPFGPPVPPLLSEASADCRNCHSWCCWCGCDYDSLPARLSPLEFPPALHATTRVTECFVRLGPMEVRVIAAYGVPSSHFDAKAVNDHLHREI